MKRLFVSVFLALLAAGAAATTLNPVQLLNPAGSTAGQVIASTGASSAPAWTTLSGIGYALTANPLSQFASTTSAQLAGVISDETGSGGLVFSNSPALVTPTATTATTGTNTTQVATTAFVNSSITVAHGRLINIQVFTSSGTYTPAAGANSAIVEVMAPGGGTGGNAATSTAQTAMSAPGNAGAYGKIWISSGLTTQTVTIGAVGAAGAATPTAGGTGGTTSFGSLISCLGGAGGAAGTAVANTTSFIIYPSTTAATCSGTGTFLTSGTGASGEKGFDVTGQVELPGSGASTMWGQGGQGRTTTPNAGTGYGAGAGAFYLNASTAATAGAAGAPAIVIVEEFN